MSSSPTTQSTETTGPGNAATVAGIYAAFGRGDVPAILSALAEDVRWEEWADNTAQRAGVEHLTPRRGPAEVAGFFELVGTWTLLRFEVLDIIGDGRQVVAEISGSFELPNGARLDDEELHLWTFDDTGRVTRFRHYADTAKHIAVSRGGTTPGE
ncbi:nuclear transport factor 2 family protein [Geodermatophilus sp. SYSU D00965]